MFGKGRHDMKILFLWGRNDDDYTGAGFSYRRGSEWVSDVAPLLFSSIGALVHLLSLTELIGMEPSKLGQLVG